MKGNVIVDGEVESMESHRRSKSKSERAGSNSADLHWGKTSAGSAPKSSSENVRNAKDTTGKYTSESVSQADAAGSVVELTVESEGGTRETVAQYRNHFVHIEGGKVGETLSVELTAGDGYLVGRSVPLRE